MSSTRGSWNGSPNGNWWGLLQKKGPWNETSDDRNRAKDRGGYPHAGHVNWFDRLTPSSGVPTILPRESFFLPKKDRDTVLMRDTNFHQTRGMRKQETVPTMAQFARDRAPLVATRSVREVAPLGFNVYGSMTETYTNDRDQNNKIHGSKLSIDTSPDASYHTGSNASSSPYIAAFTHPLVQSPQDYAAEKNLSSPEMSSTGLSSYFSDDTPATRAFTMPTKQEEAYSPRGRRHTDQMGIEIKNERFSNRIAARFRNELKINTDVPKVAGPKVRIGRVGRGHKMDEDIPVRKSTRGTKRYTTINQF